MAFSSAPLRYVTTAFLSLTVIPLIAQVAAVRPSTWATPQELGGLGNCYKIDHDLYRSQQPKRSDFRQLEAGGFKTVVNLRNIRKDNRKARGTTLQLVHIPVNTWKMSYDDVVSSLKAVQAADDPVLLHCIHGSDRTGVVVAAYRMVEEGWTKEAAIDEFLNGGYGYHTGWFPNILRLLEALEVEKLKADVGRTP